MIHYILFIIQAVSLFFLSRLTTNEIFYFLRLFIKDEKINFITVSLLFLPGTILHELSHYLAATVLFMKVRDVKIFPEFEKNEIKLGRVLYEKKDVVRGILVGIAPFFAGAFFFWMIAYFKLFPNQNITVTILLVYLIFAVSSTMFSSKQDLVDIILIIPVLLILGGIVYVFDVRFDWILKNKIIIEKILEFFKKVNTYLFFSIIINFVILFLIKIFRKAGFTRFKINI